MFWVQLMISFLIWTSGGGFLSRRPNPVRRLSQRYSRTARALFASVLMIGCLALLFLPLSLIVQRGGLNGGPMSVPIWLTVTFCGAAFVLANTISMAVLVTLAREAAVTETQRFSSRNQDLDK